MIPPFIPDKKPASFLNVKKNHFLFVGQVTPQKGIHLLIEQFMLALTEEPHLILKIVGEGESKKKLMATIKDCHLEKNIQFYPWQDNLTSFYQQCSCVIFPSLSLESFGLVITEAMSFARTVIAINQGTAKWLVENNHSGLLFDVNVRNDLATKILELYRSDRAETFGICAQKRLYERFDNQHTLKTLLKCYTQLII